MRQGYPVQDLLILEDEKTLLKMLTLHLENAGYSVRGFTDYQGAAGAVRSNPPDMAILDINVPGGNGLELLREIRCDMEIPVIMISARRSEIDRVLGLELGADDYLPKPFSARELVARVKSVFRRTGGFFTPTDSPKNVVDWGGVQLDLDGRALGSQGSWTPLTPKEFSIIKKLLSQPGQVFNRAQLTEADGSPSRAIDNHVNNLRRKLEALGPGLPTIQSIRGVGYQLR
jgi:DNA-binding response OmpR family regulator